MQILSDCHLRRTTAFMSSLFFSSNLPVREPSELHRQQKAFGANVRRERNLNGFTQARLAELADLTLRNVQRIEAGEMNALMTTVVRLRHALGCSADKLIPGA